MAGSVFRRTAAVDAGVALGACLVGLGVLAGGGLGASPVDARGLDLPGAALILLATAPLVVRRRAPAAVYAAVTAATLALFTLDYPADVPVGPAVAAYTLGAGYGGAAPARRVGSLVAVVGFVPAAAVAFAVGGADVSAILVPELLFVALSLAALWIAGDRSRLRQAHLAALAERTRRAARDVERERQMATAEERLRIARELHDSAGHAINVILVQAGAARLLQDRDPDATREAITTVERVARDTIGEIDRLVRALRAEDGAGAPADPGGPAAVEELVAGHRGAGLRLAVDVSGSGQELPPSVAWAAYRILQESLTNAARHGAGSADLRVRYRPAEVEIEVRNPVPSPRPGRDGGNGAAGPPERATPPGGHGIVGMRERATLLGGSFEAAPTTEGTFRLHAKLPHPAGVATR